jgi:hypothetical protein
MSGAAEVLNRLRIARMHRPHTLVFGLALPIPGALAVVYGDEVSAALSNIGTGYVSLVMGLALLIGGVLTTVGLGLHKALLEAAGMCVMAVGCFIYGAGVIMGLGLAGAVAGTMSLSIAAGMVLRVWSLLVIAGDRAKWERYNQEAGGST